MKLFLPNDCFLIYIKVDVYLNIFPPFLPLAINQFESYKWAVFLVLIDERSRRNNLEFSKGNES